MFDDIIKKKEEKQPPFIIQQKLYFLCLECGSYGVIYEWKNKKWVCLSCGSNKAKAHVKEEKYD